MGDYMRLFAIINKKNLFLALGLVVISLCLVVNMNFAYKNKIDGSTNAIRVKYLERLGYSVCDSAVSSKQITIPMDFSDVYLKYNEIQKKAGFDLSDYKGKIATVYTYSLNGESNVNITLIVCDNVIIGGDVGEIRFGGEMKPLLSRKL